MSNNSTNVESLIHLEKSTTHILLIIACRNLDTSKVSFQGYYAEAEAVKVILRDSGTESCTSSTLKMKSIS